MISFNRALRNSFLLCFTIFLTHNLTAQTLFTYGKNEVSSRDFMRAYSRNATGEKPTEASLREYLELYARFKMKVASAMEAGYDTSSRQKEELMNFREQIASSYMKDEASLELLVSEAMERNSKEIQIAHIFIGIAPGATPEERATKEAAIQNAYAALKAGRSFSSVAEKFSEDPAVKTTKGIVGYITAFVLPYEMENVVYNLPKGSFSEPLKSKTGLHIFQKLNERSSRGKIKAAHILFAFPPGADNAQKATVKARADSVHQAIQSGADFGTLAAQFSNDISSFSNSGIISEFGVGEYDLAFENAAFSLEKDSAVSVPVLTDFGYHIIKRLGFTPTYSRLENEEQREFVRQRVLQNDRMNVAKKILVNKINKTIDLVTGKYNRKSLQAWSENILENKPYPYPADIKPTTELFRIGQTKTTVADWEQYLLNVRNSPEAASGFDVLFEEFNANHAVEYYETNLEKFNEDFRYQLAEFREGNLLFEVMQKKIWDVAASDSSGLLTYFNKNKAKYWWEASANAILFSVPDEKTADSVKQLMTSNPSLWKQLAQNSEGTILADSARFELSQIPVAGRTNFTPGLLTANVKNEVDNTIIFSYIIKVHIDREPRSFEDARGFVINDYQTFLEEKWVNELKKKYPIKVNERVFKTLLK